MNIFEGHILDIKVNESLSMVSVQIGEHIELKTIVVETPETASYLEIGNTVNVLFKETEVIIGKENIPLISIQNKIKGNIKTLEKGVLLSKVTVVTSIGDIVSILATEALDRLELIEDQKVVAMIKMNEIMLSI